jgi:probable HAF family extracellular repeat protein
MTKLPTLGGPATARRINDAKKVVGSSAAPAYPHAFLYSHSNDSISDLGTLGGLVSQADDINASGQVVSPSTAADDKAYLFLYSNGKMTNLTIPVHGGRYNKVNASGQVIGTSITTKSKEYPFFYSNGKMTNLNNLIDSRSGWKLLYVDGINDAGHIVGEGTNPEGNDHASLLTPPRN